MPFTRACSLLSQNILSDPVTNLRINDLLLRYANQLVKADRGPGEVEYPLQGRRKVLELGGGGFIGGESERGSLFVSRMLLPSFFFLPKNYPKPPPPLPTPMRWASEFPNLQGSVTSAGAL